MPENLSEVSKTPLTVKGLWNTEKPLQAIEFHVRPSLRQARSATWCSFPPCVLRRLMASTLALHHRRGRSLKSYGKTPELGFSGPRHSSTLAWQIPWAEDPGRLQSMGSLRVGHDWATSLLYFTFMHWRRKWQPVFLPEESQEWGNLVGCHLWGHAELDMTEAT